MNRLFASTALIALLTMGLAATAHADTVNTIPGRQPSVTSPSAVPPAAGQTGTAIDSQKKAVEPSKDVSGAVKTDETGKKTEAGPAKTEPVKTDKTVGKTSQLKSHHLKAQPVKATVPAASATKAAQ